MLVLLPPSVAFALNKKKCYSRDQLKKHLPHKTKTPNSISRTMLKLDASADNCKHSAGEAQAGR